MPDLLSQLRPVRRFTESLCEGLVTEDYVVQSMPDVSPTKWHLAHTSWFFETFILKPYDPSYRPINEGYAFLFNSYYVNAGERHCRAQRGYISRPTVEEVFDFRRHVDAAMMRLLENADEKLLAELDPLVTIGIHHEQQHQELMVTDIKHVFSVNPLRPALRPGSGPGSGDPGAAGWVDFDGGLQWIGHDGQGFAYDNEGPRHQEFIQPFSLADRLVTNGEYLAFMEDGGYARPDLWLSMGWATAQENGWTEPFYWEKVDGEWLMFTLSGRRPVDPAEPAAHLSYFEADAYARWAGARLPTEAEWEVAAATAPRDGTFAESGLFHPKAAEPSTGRLRQMYGELWEWTRSPYTPYPGYQPPAGALGEYNGKFMCNQYVLRGGLLRNLCFAYPTDLSELLSSRGDLAVYRAPTGEGSVKAVQVEGVGSGLILYDNEPTPDRICEDVARGLTRPQKKLPSKYFYDDAGAELFERIMELDAYYPTRTEISILERYVGEIVGKIGPGAALVEFGSGSGDKTWILLRNLEDPAAYVPVDISRAQLVEFAGRVADAMPDLTVMPICADYTADFNLPGLPENARRNVGFFPGSTIGNFEPGEAAHFLRRLRRILGPDGGMVLGIDLRKDPETIERAYNDPEGVTARFNLNLLSRINRECGANFDLSAFRHLSFFDDEASRIETRIVSERQQTVSLRPDPEEETRIDVHFEPGEFIITEYSHKYDIESFGALALETGWRIEEVWKDEKEWFAVVLLR